METLTKSSFDLLGKAAEAKKETPAAEVITTPAPEAEVVETPIVETPVVETPPAAEPAAPKEEEVEIDDWRAQPEEVEGAEPNTPKSDWDDLNAEFGWQLASADDVKSQLRSLIEEKTTLANKQDEIRSYFANSDAQVFAEVLRDSDKIIAEHADNPKAATEALTKHIVESLSPFISNPAAAPKTELAKYALMSSKFRGLSPAEASAKADEFLAMKDEDTIDSLADVGLEAAQAQIEAQRRQIASTYLESYKKRKAEKALEHQEVEKAIDSITELDGGFKLKYKTRDKEGKVVTIDGNANLKRLYNAGGLSKLNIEAYRGKDGKIDYKSYAQDAANFAHYKDVAAVAAQKAKSEAHRKVIMEGKNVTKTTAAASVATQPIEKSKNDEFLGAMKKTFKKP